MGAYVKHGGDYTYNTESSYNYQVNGSIININVISTPTKVFGGENLTSVLSNTMLRLQVQKEPMGIVEDVDVTALQFLGDSAQLNFVNAMETENLWVEDLTFSFNSLIDDYTNHTHIYDLPNVVNTGLMLVKLKMKNWQYFNTYDNLIQNVTFDIAFGIYPQIIQLSGELDDIVVSTDLTQFNIAGRYVNPGSFNGTLKNYLDSFTVSGTLIDNVDDDEVSYNAWDLLKLGFVFTPDKNATAQTFSGSQATIVYNVANTFFSGCDSVGDSTTQVTITFNYFDLVTDTEKSATFVCELRLYGLENILILATTNNFLQGLFDQYSFYKSMTDSSGNSSRNTLLDINTNLYNSMTLTITNTDTSTTYTTSDDLPNGHYKIQASVLVNPLITMNSNEYRFNVYKGEIADMDIQSYYTYYRVGNEFTPSSFVVTLKRLIYGSDYYTTRIYYPQYTTNYDGYTFDIDDVPSVDVTFTYVDENYGTFTKTISINVVAPTGDYVYIFDKKTLVAEQYGEMQQGFNFNFVLDQTKDNAKIEILNREQSDIKPFTIVYLESTNTWWIVKSDNVTRYTSELTPLYKHTINLLGAIEILNARDLTNCGFNVDHYTIDSFLTRLLSLTDFELPIEIDYGTYLYPNKKVDYLKTFENYSPLSALKEMCNGMNVKPELNFVASGGALIKAILTFVPNSGIDNAEIDISVFDDVQEKITSDKENYGSKVVSNVQNCTNGEVVRFPATGTVALSGEGYKLTYENACIRLPTKAKEVKELDICGRYGLGFGPYESSLIQHTRLHVTSNSDVYNEAELNHLLDDMATQIENSGYDLTVKSAALSYLNNERDLVIKRIQENGVTRLISGALYDTQGSGWNGKQVPINYNGTYEITNVEPSIGPWRNNSIGLNEKRFYDTFSNQKVLTYWEQGSDLIKNFYWFDSFTGGQDSITWEGHDNTRVLEIFNINYGGQDYKFVIVVGSHPEYGLIMWKIESGGQGIGFSILGSWAARYVVWYVPQADVKLKVENGILDNDTNLYNQNGTLVSAKAVSKLVNSHSVAISSNQITRYKRYYSYGAIPKIGQIVNNNGEKYVINNVSIDFAENDSNLYALDCMFTLTKQIACKSTMISANSVIRDYPTPQNNNIKRIQCYRDYIVLSYEQINEHNSYLPISNVLGFFDKQFELGEYVGYVDNHTAFIQVYFVEPTTTLGLTYYYQLQSFKMDMQRMFVEIIDFKDNNIIGYSGQNTSHPFTFSEWYQAIFTKDQMVVPISYVDSVGELIGVTLLLSDNDQVSTLYQEIAEQEASYDKIQGIYNATCVIPSEIYDKVRDDELYDFGIYETEYNKDGLEIPVFQYSCQINGLKGIELSSDIIKGNKLYDTELYVYRFKVVDNAYLTEENGLLFASSKDYISYQNSTLTVDNNVLISLDTVNNKLDLTFALTTAKPLNGSGMSIPAVLSALGKTILIYRNKVNVITDNIASIGENEFVMALNNCPSSVSDSQLSINIATYKLK